MYKLRFVSVQWQNKLASAMCVYCALNIHGRGSAFTHFHSAYLLLLRLSLFLFAFVVVFPTFVRLFLVFRANATFFSLSLSHSRSLFSRTHR